mmetsp:Transcript_11852/g.30059  ORF Transcript_11852/g.30059 Transcript_11852/m.30059 type:complete len:246 (-) Transcript_11852:593-1330(-)|eukprot:CAMPEP_0116088992 /NCGR_PEP_ID=MMETSP0327-20121206/6189_1 /TAXON_ID=44447 /ORGANISM="Pseudo-nitzschia delicatissima, Strain B596" /LENGTH=245 /DNA_ID=CAMNT_0003580157 /DNA_START=28 /DNA_END=765 /DNA_ORIENTATION=-
MSNDENSKGVPAQKLTASSDMCYCCFDTLIDALQDSKHSNNESKPVPDFVKQLANPSVQCPLFVTWEKCGRNESTWQLRGCIGCLSPRPLATDVAEYALISALNDRRFKPIALEEIHSLRVSVSLLVDYEDCKHVYDWTVGVHGILIKFAVKGRRYDGTFLPEVAKQQGWDHAQTIDSLIRKAGYNGSISPQLLNGIKCTRYQSSKCPVTYGEYVNVKCEGVDPIYNPLDSKRGQTRSWSPCKNM